MKPKELQKFIEALPSADRAKIYKDYHDNIEKYIDGGGYRDLNDYLKGSAIRQDYLETAISWPSHVAPSPSTAL